MNPRQIANAVHLTLAALDEYGAILDKPTRTKLEAGIKDARTIESWRPDDRGGVAQAAYEALTAANDPSTDEAVMRAVVTDRLAAAQIAVRNFAGTRLAKLVNDALDLIVVSLDGAYRQHVADPMVESRAALLRHGIEAPDTDPAEVISRGSGAVSSWSAVLAANEAHNRILGVFGQLWSSAGGTMTTVPELLWIDPGEQDIYALRDLGKSPHPWTVLDAAMALSLTTPAGASQRHQRAAENIPKITTGSGRQEVQWLQ